MVTEQSSAPAGIRHLALRARQALGAVLDPRRVRVQLTPCFTRTAAALGFDLAVFAVLGLMMWRLLSPWDEPLHEGGHLMLLGLMAFALFWLSITEPDFWRFAKLRRRWLARHRAPVEAALDLPSRPVALSQWPEDLKAPMRVRSAYRPARPAQPAPRWAWRAPS